MSERRPRLFTQAPLAEGADVPCDASQANYLLNVLRRKTGDEVLIFNGMHGEWVAEIAEAKRNRCTLRAKALTRPQTPPQDIHYLFAPLKHARLDYMVQKATELGVAALRPVMTAHTISERVNLDRMRANAIEAAEQCGILTIPEIYAAEKLESVLKSWPGERRLIYADEAAPITSPVAALSAIPKGPLGVLIGPEGGFSDGEREMLRAQSFVFSISLGPRIMRADTAAVAILALVNAVLGDWA